MPQAIPLIVSAVGTAAGLTAVEAGVLALVSSLVVGNYEQSRAKRKERAAYNAAQVDRFANVVATVAPRELVLGRVRKGGAVAFRATTGQYSSAFYVHMAIAAHEIDAVEEVWFNDQRVTINPATAEVLDEPYRRGKSVSAAAIIPAGATSVVLPYDPLPGVGATVADVENQTSRSVPLVVSGRTVSISAEAGPVTVVYQYTEYTQRAWVWVDKGDYPVASADTMGMFPGVWTSAHIGTGIAKLVCRFDYDETAFPSGPPAVTAVIRGAKVYDPRTGVTQWSENPALLARHVYQHPNFGKATVSAAEDARFIAAANASDAFQAWVVNGVVDTQRLYRAGGVFPFGASAASVLDDLTQSMAGMWAFAGGELFIRAGTYTAPVATFGDSDLAVIQREGEAEQQNKIVIAPHRERVNKFNVVSARIWDASQQYKQVGLTPLKGTALIARDGEELAQEVDVPAVSYAPQALHIAGVMMRDARDPLTIEVPLKMTAYAVELLDTIALSFSRYGWNASPKAFIVLGRVWDRSRGVIRLTCKETNAAIFTRDAAFLPGGYAANTSIPSPWTISPPGTLTISSGTSELVIGADGTVITRVRVSWPAITDPRILAEGKVEVQWCVASVGAWTSLIVDGDVSHAFLTGAADGLAILVRARTRTSLATSDWGQQQLHIVVGKTEPPGVPTGVSLTQELVFFRLPPDLDLAGVRIRSIPGLVSAPVFSRGTDVIAGLIRTSPARIEGKLYGVQTVMVVSEDTSGNQSAPAFATLDFGQPDVASAVWTRVFAAESFPGTYTLCSLWAGAVVAYADPGSDVYPLDNVYGEPDLFATLYQTMEWDSDLVLPPYAGTLSLASTFLGNSPQVEYRISGDTITDLYASSNLYASANVYGVPGAWTLWPGALQVARATPLEFRVMVGSGSQQGTIAEFTPSLVMDVKDQAFTNVTVDSAGTRLAPSAGNPARNWVGAIRAIYGSPSVDGSGAIALRVLDYSPDLGPLVQFVDITGAAVTAKGTVKVEGFSDE